MIYVVGHIVYDHLIYVRNFPKPNSAVPVQHIFDLFGGAAANCAMVISKLWGRASLISLVGDDFPNSDYERHLSENGIELKHVKVVRGEMTSRAFMPVDSRGNQISFFYWGASAHFSKARVPKLELKKTDIIHIANGDPNFNGRLVERYKDNIISFDPGYDIAIYSRSDLERLFIHSDFLFCNELELKLILSKLGLRNARQIIKHGIKCLVVTRGEKGSVIHTKEGTIRVKAYKTKLIDPTGAGDSYRAAFLTAFSKGNDLETCGKIGSAVASYVIEKVGAQTNIPSWRRALARAKKL